MQDRARFAARRAALSRASAAKVGIMSLRALHPTAVLTVLTLALCPQPARAQCNSFPAGGTLGGIINSYYAGTGTRAAGSLFVTVDTAYGVLPGGAAAIAAGDLLMIMQMQDATITSTNTECYGDNTDETGGTCTNTGANGSGATAQNSAGLFEYVIALGAVGTGSCGSGSAQRICILGAGAGGGLLNSYATAARTAARGQRTYQVIRVRQYLSASLSNTLTAYRWDGRVGGVLAFDVHSALNLNNATVSVNGLGFRGARGQQLGGVGSGAANSDYRNSVSTSTSNCNFNRLVHGTKGEGTAGTPRQLPNTFDDDGTVPGGAGCDGYPNGERARGAPGTAGGGGNDGNPTSNDQNSGGGGGGNGGAGGLGGNSFDSNLAVGGFGGAAFPATLGALTARLTLGGGGGSATRNNTPAVPDAGSGAVGGGIVIIRAGSVTGNGTLTANGLTGVPSDNDGGGGGGAGGTVAVLVGSGDQNGLTVQARGGNGGDAWITHDPCVPRLPPGCAYPGERHGPGGGGGGGVVFLTFAPTTAPDVSGGARGLTTTVLDPFGALNGAPGVVTLGGLPTDTPGVQTCLLTRATLQGLRVLPGSLEFAVASQRGTRGFHVYAETGGLRRRLNEELLVAPAPDSSAPLVYRLATSVAAPERLWIEELETGGGRRLLGPYASDDARLREAFDDVERRLEHGADEGTGAARAFARRRLRETPRALPSATRAQQAAPALGRARAEAGALKIEVREAGLVSVPLSDLIAAGLPAPLSSQPGALRLHNLGRPVPFTLTSDALSFAADAFDSDYTRRNGYVLTWAGQRPGAPRVAFTRSGLAAAGLTRIEHDLLYAPFAPRAADPWVWDVLSHDTPAGPYAFDLPGLAPGNGQVRVRLLFSGATRHVHRVTAELNGTPLGTLEFEGQVAAELKTRVPRTALLASGNALSFTYVASGGDEPPEHGLVFFDAVDVDVRLPQPSAKVTAERLAPYDARFELPPATDYLIVSHADFLPQAARLAELKAAEGRRPFVVDVERAYDRYASGLFEAEAVHALLREARQRAHVRDVLLFGDDTFDPRGDTGAGLVSYVPSLDGWDGQFGRIPSENRYADLDGDGRPDVAIGRLPAQTPEQATALVDKIEGQQAMLAQLAGRELFAVDDSGSAADGTFRNMADRVAAALPFKPEFADVREDGAAQARAKLLAALGGGREVVHYFGHGGPEAWGDEGLLLASDAAGLAGSGRQSLLMTWACESQWYQYDWGPSINEALLLAPDGGVLAAVGPTGISAPRLQVVLAQAVYDRLRAGLALGEAVRQAKAEILALDPQAGAVVDGWSLLGDPALRLSVTTSR